MKKITDKHKRQSNINKKTLGRSMPLVGVWVDLIRGPEAPHFCHPISGLPHLLKRYNLLPGLFIYLFATLCGPVASSTGAHGFVI